MQRAPAAAAGSASPLLLGAACAAVGAGRDSAARLESVTVSNTSSTPVKAPTVLQAGHRYRLRRDRHASRTGARRPPRSRPTARTARRSRSARAWMRSGATRPGGCADEGGMAAAERERQGDPRLRRALTRDKVPVSAGHSYTFEFDGVSGPLTLGSSDALGGSTSDNSGSFKRHDHGPRRLRGGDDAGTAVRGDRAPAAEPREARLLQRTRATAATVARLAGGGEGVPAAGGDSRPTARAPATRSARPRSGRRSAIGAPLHRRGPCSTSRPTSKRARLLQRPARRQGRTRPSTRP